MTGMANGAPPAPSGHIYASSDASSQSMAPTAGSEPVFQPSPEQQQLLQQARAHAASLALQSARRRDLAAHAAAPSTNSSAVAVSKLQQRAAAAAQALGSERKISAREIQVMLEKNEAALRMWNALHRQQPSMHQQLEHKEWLKKCYLYRQQIGARLEVLASLADKQIAQEDAKGQTTATGKKTTASTPTSKAKANSASKPKASKKSPANAKTALVATASRVAAGVNANAASAVPTPFPANPVPATSGVQSQPFDVYRSTGVPTTGSGAMSSAAMSNSSAALNSSMTGSTAMSTAIPPTSVPAMSAPMSASQSSAFEPTAFDSTAATTASSYMNQAQNYMMNPATIAMNAMGASNGNGMMSAQQFMMMQMPMGMNMAAAGMYNQPNMFANVNYGMMGGGANPLPMDPFNASLSGFGQPAMGFPNAQPNMNGPGIAYGMPGSMQAAQMMNPMGGGYPSLMVNSFQYGTPGGAVTGMPPSTQAMTGQQRQQQPQQGSQMFQAGSVMSAGLYQPQLQAQPSQQPPSQQQPQRQPQQQPQDPSSSGLLPDAALFGDEDMGANLFEGFSDDVFLPLQ